MINMIGIRTIILCILFTVVFSGLYAQAPELRTVMPNSWQKVTRLTPEQEAAFFRENQNRLNIIINEWGNGSFVINNNNISRITRVYREQAGVDIFYRLITANSVTPDFTNQEEISFLQTLLYEYKGRKIILAYGSYNRVITGKHDHFAQYESLDITRSRDGAKGILFTQMECTFEFIGGKRTFTSIVKGQLAGYNVSNYILMKDIIDVLDKKPNTFASPSVGGYYYFGDAPRIQIEASPCLVDLNNPLRYSLQNAFDGDPSTSYVENTEDDLMKISLSGIGLPVVTKLAVINGYAQNLTLYNSNNRIKKFTSLGKEMILNDGMLSYQYMTEDADASLWVTEIYRGDQYNDTCIAELNFLTADGWLFGEIDD